MLKQAAGHRVQGFHGRRATRCTVSWWHAAASPQHRIRAWASASNAGYRGDGSAGTRVCAAALGQQLAAPPHPSAAAPSGPAPSTARLRHRSARHCLPSPCIVPMAALRAAHSGASGSRMTPRPLLPRRRQPSKAMLCRVRMRTRYDSRIQEHPRGYGSTWNRSPRCKAAMRAVTPHAAPKLAPVPCCNRMPATAESTMPTMVRAWASQALTASAVCCSFAEPAQPPAGHCLAQLVASNVGRAMGLGPESSRACASSLDRLELAASRQGCSLLGRVQCTSIHFTANPSRLSPRLGHFTTLHQGCQQVRPNLGPQSRPDLIEAEGQVSSLQLRVHAAQQEATQASYGAVTPRS